MVRSGIYGFFDKKNGKCYIGSSVDVFKRRTSHKCRLRKGTHTNTILQNSWTKYGESNFDWSFIEPVANKNELIEREQVWVDIFPDACLFNIERVVKSYQTERRISVRQRASERMKGNKYAVGNKPIITEEQKVAISNKLKGTRHSDESYKIAAEKRKGYKPTQESRIKQSISARSKKPIIDKTIVESLKPGSGNWKLTEDKVLEIRKLYSEGMLGTDLCVMFGVGNATIYNIVNRKTWKHI